MKSLRETRREKLVSIESLADKSGVSTKTIVETELGRSVPKLRTIKRISDALGVDPMAVQEFAGAIRGDEDLEKNLAA